MLVKSTYNFVPAPTESEVFTPGWADQVSHDIPFSDGESGEIELKITAKTPVFIRNGHTKDDADTKNENYLSFSHRVKPDGTKEYFIPATSLKGMVRNVLEMVSRGRMSKVNDHRHAVRQIMRANGVVANEEYGLADDKASINAGWLIEKEGNYYIIDCGRPKKVRYTDLDTILETETSFADQFGTKLLSEMNEKFSARTGKYKYENVMGATLLEHYFEDHPLDEEGQSSWVSRFQSLGYVRFSEKGVEGSYPGTIVCVGQAMSYNEKTPRKGEYVFLGDKSTKINQGRRIEVPMKVMEDFLFVNGNNKSDELEDWTYWKDKMEEGVPVFFRRETIKKVSRIKDFGLTFMYKEPARNSVKDSYPINTYPQKITKSYKPDFAETIFGFTTKEKSLMGRVFFSNVFLEGEVKFSPEQSVVLSSPKSSFYPFYMKQKGKNGKTHSFFTYNNKPELSGFKRYPVRNEKKDVDASELREEMKSKFIPLKEESVFRGKLRFHNLRKAEIGALISVLTFHESNKEFYHNIGYAKPLGYGKVEMKISFNKDNFKFDNISYIKAFEYEILKKDDKWHRSDTVKEFLSMASNPPEEVEFNLDYLDVTNFQGLKDDGYYLERYSKYMATDFQFPRYISDEEQKEWTKKEVIKQKHLQAKKEAQSQNLIQQADAAIKAHDFELAKSLYKEANQVLDDGKLDERLKNVSTKKVKFETTTAFAAAKEANTVEFYKQFLRDYPNSIFHSECSRLKNELEAEELGGDLILVSYSYKDIKYEAKSRLKNKAFQFSDTQKKQLIHAITESFALESKNPKKSTFHKKKKLRPFGQYPWTEISGWIGMEDAQSLYVELTKG